MWAAVLARPPSAHLCPTNPRPRLRALRTSERTQTTRTHSRWSKSFTSSLRERSKHSVYLRSRVMGRKAQGGSAKALLLLLLAAVALMASLVQPVRGEEPRVPPPDVACTSATPLCKPPALAASAHGRARAAGQVGIATVITRMRAPVGLLNSALAALAIAQASALTPPRCLRRTTGTAACTP